VLWQGGMVVPWQARAVPWQTRMVMSPQDGMVVL
jgi:hypothetical protein